MKPSGTAKVISGLLRLINLKKRVEKMTHKPIARSKKEFIPSKIQKAYTVLNQTLNDHAIATFESKERVTDTHIIFLHGGAYVFEAISGHWAFAQKLVDKQYCRMTLIDYPLAPEHTHRETYEMVEGAYELLIEQYPNDTFVLFGDSAGAGLALGFCQKLIKEKHPKAPAKMILQSPWLDITMSHPGIEKQQTTDHMLSVDMLKHTGSQYAGGDDPNHYLLSPIYGEFQDLPPTLVFYSTAELFYPDCEKLKAIASSTNSQFTFSLYEGMLHDWIVFPIPERDRVVDEICDFIEG